MSRTQFHKPIDQVTLVFLEYVHIFLFNPPSLDNEKGFRQCPKPFRALLGTRTLDPLIKSQLLYQLS